MGQFDLQNYLSLQLELPTTHPSFLVTNPGTALNLDWLEDVRVNASAVSRRTQSLTGRRSVKGPWQTAWLLHAIQCMDLTTLSSDDTPKRVQRLCAKARQPIRPELVKSLGIESLNLLRSDMDEGFDVQFHAVAVSTPVCGGLCEQE